MPICAAAVVTCSTVECAFGFNHAANTQRREYENDQSPPDEPGRADLPVGLDARQRVPTAVQGSPGKDESDQPLTPNPLP